LIAQIALAKECTVFAFTRPGDSAAQFRSPRAGVHWAGDSDETAPAPWMRRLYSRRLGALVPAALAATQGGRRQFAPAFSASDIPSFPYALLWGARSISSGANLTRQDGQDFLDLAARIPLSVQVELFPLSQANEALARLRSGKLSGAAVLTTGA
jgi:propanol-preferring alcohol dehydrogenase